MVKKSLPDFNIYLETGIFPTVLMVQPVENQFGMSRFPTCLGSYPGYLVIAIRVFEYRARLGEFSYRESVRVIRYCRFEQFGMEHWVDLIHCW